MRGDTTETSNLDRILQQIQIQNSNPSSFPPSDMSTRTDIGLLQPQKPKSLPWWDFSNLPVWEGTLPGTPKQAAYHLTELAKDVSPVVGPYRSAVRSGIETEKAKGLLQEGKYIEAIPPSIWSGLESIDASLSAIPVLGAAATLPIDLARTAKNTLFTSPAQKAVSEVSQEALPGKQWLKQLEGRGVKKDELEWTGLLEFLSDKKGNIPKSEVDDFIEANKIEVREVMRGGRPEINQDSKYVDEVVDAWASSNGTFDDTRLWLTNDEGFYRSLMDKFPELRKMEEAGESWEDYIIKDVFGKEPLQVKFGGSELQLPGGSDYKELVLTWPGKKIPYTKEDIVPITTEEYMKREYPDSPRSYGQQFLYADHDYWFDTPDGLKRVSKKKYDSKDFAHITNEADKKYIDSQIKSPEEALEEAIKGMNEAKKDQPMYTGGHYPEDNVLAHIRFNERITPEGESMLFIEEMQSDWAHKGLDQGFSAPMNPELKNRLEKEMSEKSAELKEAANKHFGFVAQEKGTGEAGALEEMLHQINVTPEGQFGAYLGIPQDEASRIFGLPMEIGALESRLAGTGVPKAPFVTDTHQWTNLGLKRMIKYAADNGFDSIAWTTGKQQGKRYHKLKPVRSMRFKKAPLLEDTYVIQAFEGKNATSPTGKPMQLHDSKTHFSEAELRKVFGDDIADEIIAPTGKSQVSDDYRSLKDIKGLEVGGEYGKFIYDKVMTEQAKKIGKKHGAKVEKTNLHGSGEKSWLEKNDDAGGYDLYWYEDGEVHDVNIPIDDKLEAERFADTFLNTEIKDGRNVSMLDPGDPPKVEDVGRLRYEVRDIEGDVVDAFETKEAAQQAADDLSWERGDTHGGEVYDLYEEAYEQYEKRVQRSHGQEVWTMKLTDKLMKAAKEGLPYYALVPPGLLAAGAQREQRERQSLLE